MSQLETREISKAYRGRRVVDGVSVSVQRGEVVGLLGPNGAGKTTSFYMIVGLISPVSQPYCGNCNRMRLTADGKFHLCLLNDDELDVRAALRNSVDDEGVRRILLRAVAAKPTGHHLERGISTEDRSMYQLGG